MNIFTFIHLAEVQLRKNQSQEQKLSRAFSLFFFGAGFAKRPSIGSLDVMGFELSTIFINCYATVLMIKMLGQ